MTTTSTRHPEEIDASVAQQMLESGRAILIDVREADEHARERIPGSRLMPLSRFDPSQVPMSNGSRVILHCRSGTRSAEAANLLLASGHDQVAHVKGGLTSWKKAGLPVEGNAGAPIGVMRQVQITIGTFVLLGTVLGAVVSPWFLILAGFMGAGLVFAGITGTCGMASMIARLPWNRRGAACRNQDH